jgi:adenosine kinase
VNKTPLVISGSIAIDRIMHFSGKYSDHIRPEALDSLSVSIFLDQLQDAYGGVGANIAYSLALLGDEPYLLGSVGPDAVAYMERLAHDGVNITHVHESKLNTATFNVITDDAQNQVGGFYPGAMFDSDTLSFEPWANADPLVVISPHDPQAMKRQVAECEKWSLRMMYDIGQQVTNLPGKDMAEGVRAAEILILNEYELSVLSEKTNMDPTDIKATVPIVITTYGKKGSVIEGSRVPRPIQVGIAKPKQMGDPTGAGDAYRAGFLYGFTRGWHLKAAAQLGAVLSSYAIEESGTQAHRCDLNDAKARYKTAFSEDLPSVS